LSRLADEPLPSGFTALNEALLLGRALLGTSSAQLEETVLVDEAWSAAGIPRRDVTVRVITRQRGRQVGEQFIGIDAAGRGRHYAADERPAGPLRTLVVETTTTPAQDRFLRLHRYLQDQLAEAREIAAAGGPAPHPVALRRGAFVENAAHAIRHVHADAPRPVLQELADRYGPDGASPLDLGPHTAEALYRATDQARRDGHLDGWASAAALIAAVWPPIASDTPSRCR
jgi:hypothetical protein